MIYESVVKDLEKMIDEGIADIAFPYQKGNSIRIRNLVIRQSKNRYHIYDCKQNIKITETHFKSSAVAIAKSLAHGKNITQKVKYLDEKLLKYHNDVVFYKNFIQSSADVNTREIRINNLEIALDKVYHFKKCLDNLIFDK